MSLRSWALEARIRGRIVAARDGLVVLDVGGRAEPDGDAAAEALLREVRLLPRQPSADAGPPRRAMM